MAAVGPGARRHHLARLGRVRPRPAAGARRLPGGRRAIYQHQQRARPGRHGRGAGPAGCRAAELRRRLAGGLVVRQRSARRPLPRPAARRAARPRDGARALERRRADDGDCAARLARRRGAAELRRHAGGQLGHSRDPRAGAAGQEGRSLPLPADGRARRQPAAGPLWRSRAAAISLARTDHARHRAGSAGVDGQDAGRGRRGRGVLRHRPGGGFRRFCRKGCLSRAGRMELAPLCAAYGGARCRGGRGRGDLHRLGAARPDDDPVGANAFPAVQQFDRAGGRGARPAARSQANLCRRLVRVFRPPAAGRQRRRAVPPRSALGRWQHRHDRHRRLYAPERLALYIKPSGCEGALDLFALLLEVGRRGR